MNLESDFVGVKVALFYSGKLLVYLRDDTPGLRFAGMWDFFGGGREGEETPFETLNRELDEELGFTIDESQVTFQKVFPAMHDPSRDAYFMAATLTNDDYASIRFGSEGQEYKLMTTDNFMQEENAVPHLKGRLKSYLDSL